MENTHTDTAAAMPGQGASTTTKSLTPPSRPVVDRVATGGKSGKAEISPRSTFLKKTAKADISPKQIESRTTKHPLAHTKVSQPQITTPKGTFTPEEFLEKAYPTKPEAALEEHRREETAASQKRTRENLTPPMEKQHLEKRNRQGKTPDLDGFTPVTQKNAAKHATIEEREREPISTSNKYESLSENESTSSSEEEMETEEHTNRKERPPPITIENDPLPSHKRREFFKTTAPEGFTARTIKAKTIRYILNSTSDFTRAVEALKKENIQYYTLTLEPARTFQVVIRQLPIDTREQDIEAELLEQNLPVRSVKQLTRAYEVEGEEEEQKDTPEDDRKERKRAPMPLFAVTLTNTQEAKKIFYMQNLLDHIITVERSRRPIGPPQCKRCQRIGHTHRNCNLAPRCVKCPGKHATTECPLNKWHDFRCCNCGGKHTANYRGCEAIITAKKKAKANKEPQRAAPQPPQFTYNKEDFPKVKGAPEGPTEKMIPTWPARNPPPAQQGTTEITTPSTSNSTSRSSSPPPTQLTRNFRLSDNREEARQQLQGLPTQAAYNILTERFHETGIAQQINRMLFDILFPPAGETSQAVALKYIINHGGR